MHLVVSKHDSVVRSLTLDADVIEIGSDPDAHVCLPDGRIAPHQAQLRAAEGGWMVVPLDLNYSLILNAMVADEPTPIKNGDEIRLGDFTVRIYLEPSAEATPVKTAVTEEVAKLRQHALPHGSVTRKEEEITLPPTAKAQIADFALRLPQCIDFAGLLNVSLSTLLKTFEARMVWIGIRRKGFGELEFVEGLRKDGKTASDPPDLETFLYRCMERNQFILIPRTDRKETTSVLAIPLLTGPGCLGLIYIDDDDAGRRYDNSDLDALMMYGALIGRQLEVTIAGQVKQRESLVDGELSFIREVQAHMDPTVFPQWDQLHLAVYCRPGFERTGDLFDIMRLPNGLASFVVAHAEASNIRAALAMAEMRAAFRMAAMHADPPHILLRALNWMLRNDREPCLLHCAAVVMNPKTGACEYATAGDIGVLIVDRNGDPRELADSTRKALGHSDEYNLPAHPERLGSDETLVLYSPGCRNVMDRNGNRLGAGPLTSALCDSLGQAPAAALDDLLTDLSAFFKEGRQPDDITMLYVYRT